jgi:hypothetical protein
MLASMIQPARERLRLLREGRHLIEYLNVQSAKTITSPSLTTSRSSECISAFEKHELSISRKLRQPQHGLRAVAPPAGCVTGPP